MFFEIMLAIIGGVLTGIITGLIPGIHVNLVSALLLASSILFLRYVSPLMLAAFIVSLATTHSFLDFIPSTFLGVPDSGTELAVLPAHKMVMKGRGKQAVVLSLVGSLFCLILAVSLSPFLLKIVKVFYETISPFIGFILLFLVGILVIKDWNSGKSVFIFVLSGLLGIAVFNLPRLNNPMFPLLSGMFGVSILVESLRSESSFPKQTEKVELEKLRSYFKPITAATIAGLFTSIFPGLGSAQGATLSQSIVKEMSPEKFLVLVGGINTVNFVLSLVTLVTVNKARNGAVSTISALTKIDSSGFWILIGASLIAGGISTILGMKIVGLFSKFVSRVPYKKLLLGIIIAIISISVILSSSIGFIVLITSTALGIWTSNIGVRKHFQMGCLIVPVLGYFLL